MSSSTTEKVNVNRHAMANGQSLLQVTLNKPKALNALDLDMARLLQKAIDNANADDSVALVLIDSEGEKAFCAGGDIVSMYNAMKEDASESSLESAAPKFLADFFTEEYRMDYTIHKSNKPVIAWGNGIIMGGGLGVFAGSSVKVVTQMARIAMPEITIGLFPDVGGSYFLNKMPKGVGHFLGLTGASINAADALAIGLADIACEHQSKQKVIQALCNESVKNDAEILTLISKVNAEQGDVELKPSKIESHISKLAPLGELSSAAEMLNWLQQYDDKDDYIERAISTLGSGSPITANLVVEQLRRSQGLSLADCFRMELNMALTCSSLGEFQEGVRALLIDKDQSPHWLYPDIGSVPSSVINGHFDYMQRHNIQPNPLQDLE